MDKHTQFNVDLWSFAFFFAAAIILFAIRIVSDTNFIGARATRRMIIGLIYQIKKFNLLILEVVYMQFIEALHITLIKIHKFSTAFER